MADDTTIRITAIGLELPSLFNIMNQDLKQHSIWLKTNKLSLNIDQTIYIYIYIYIYIIFTLSKTRGIDDYKLNIDEKLINKVDVTKFPSIHVDSKFQWDEHKTC